MPTPDKQPEQPIFRLKQLRSMARERFAATGSNLWKRIADEYTDRILKEQARLDAEAAVCEQLLDESGGS